MRASKHFCPEAGFRRCVACMPAVLYNLYSGAGGNEGRADENVLVSNGIRWRRRFGARRALREPVVFLPRRYLGVRFRTDARAVRHGSRRRELRNDGCDARGVFRVLPRGARCHRQGRNRRCAGEALRACLRRARGSPRRLFLGACRGGDAAVRGGVSGCLCACGCRPGRAFAAGGVLPGPLPRQPSDLCVNCHIGGDCHRVRGRISGRDGSRSASGDSRPDRGFGSPARAAPPSRLLERRGEGASLPLLRRHRR